MNLMNMLTGILTSGAALQALSAKTGLSEKQLKMIIAIAIPLLIRKLTSNASSQSGANSLLGALTQHRDTNSIDKQLADADEEDGAKIVGHILGSDEDKIIASVAKESGVSEADVAKVLGTISPSILSSLSAATESASAQQAQQAQQSGGVDLSDGFDMSDVMALMGGGASQSQSQNQSSGGLLGSLFGGGASQSQSQGGGGLLSALLGGAQKPEEDQEMNGIQRLNALLSMRN